MNTQFAVAPQAPGALGEDVAPQALLAYLTDLGQWRDRRRTELDELDEASLHSPERTALTADVLLSMTLWKAVSDRHDLLVATWDSGRVLETERRRMSTLIWGRLDTGAQSGSALAVSLPEACRLSDSLAAALRGRLRLEGSEPDVDNRVRDLRATVQRIRDQAELVPRAARANVQAVYDALLARTEDVAERAKRGADVGGLLPALEQDAATAERDLIVGAARRTEAKADAVRARQLRDELEARSHAVAQLAARAVAEVTPAPRLGVPDPDALGDPPADPAGVKAYLERLDLVGRALDQCQAAYAGALERRDELVAEASAYAERAAAITDPTLRADLDELAARSTATRAATPLDLRRLGALVAAQQAYLGAAGQHPNRPSSPRGTRP
ncbi:MAG: hypothetical protein M9891_01585 [Austwickia sp.]|nr:hypothetical protein [Actinomycetota bacterium]MCB1254702.1 hypothetical protein [Austwickia sp.]MCO5307985.1 hypothetical protein [Austwickia sp.]